jgi:hypothetical protein
MGGLLKKFDLLGVEFESIVAHRDSPYVAAFAGRKEGRFFNASRLDELVALIARLRRQRREGRLIFGIPMAPGSLQAFGFFWMLQQLGALNYIVDFNLINADVLTPVRRRYIFDRHLAQAAELFKRPEWTADFEMPLAMASPPRTLRPESPRRIGFFPWSGRAWLPEFRWPDAHWFELARGILQAPEVEIVILGRDERFSVFEESLRASLPEPRRSRLKSERSQSVEGLVTGLQTIDMLVTLNTSALHLAHALKLPTVALCGSSGEFWLPEASHVRIVRDERGVLPPSDKFQHDPLQPSLQRIDVNAVYAACTGLAREFGISIG